MATTVCLSVRREIACNANFTRVLRICRRERACLGRPFPGAHSQDAAMSLSTKKESCTLAQDVLPYAQVFSIQYPSARVAEAAGPQCFQAHLEVLI